MEVGGDLGGGKEEERKKRTTQKQKKKSMPEERKTCRYHDVLVYTMTSSLVFNHLVNNMLPLYHGPKENSGIDTLVP